MQERAKRNPGCAFDADWVASVRVNRSAVERRADTLTKRRTVKKDWQAAWLLRAVQTIDLTTLSGDDTPGTVRRLCAKARQPVRADLLEALGVDPGSVRVGAVCVYHAMVEAAVEALRGSGIPVAAVSTGFPAGLTPHELKLREIEDVGRGRGPRDRHRDQPAPRAHRPVEGAPRRGPRLPQGLRPGAHEDDPRHRRAGDARERGGRASCA
jgi:hypothetical protein